MELLRTEGAAGEVSAVLPASPEVPAAENADTSGGSADDKELLTKYIAGESGSGSRVREEAACAEPRLGDYSRRRPWCSSCKLRYRMRPEPAECHGRTFGLKARCILFVGALLQTGSRNW